METETTNTENLIKEILEGSKDTIKGKIKSEIEKQIMDSLSYSLRSHISDMTSKFVETEMKDDINEMLKAAKPEIIEQMKLGFVKIGAQLTEAMVIRASKNLVAGSYGTKELIKKLLD